MARDWEATFSFWAQAPGQTEQDKCDNAERAVRRAIADSDRLVQRNVAVFPQGSYRNRTNVRTEGDVDIAVRSRATFFFELPEGTEMREFRIEPATYSYDQYKNDVHQALVDFLGSGSVTRGKKAFDIHENTYRIDADALPCFEYRWYQPDGSYLEGVSFVPDGGNKVINWPEQNYENGVAKNTKTDRRFKAVVRILKALRSEMAGKGIEIAKQVPSFLIECLVWNVPNEGFEHDTLRADVRYALAHIFNNTMKQETCAEWGEINEYKYLFQAAQPWSREIAHKFADAAWDYIGFE